MKSCYKGVAEGKVYTHPDMKTISVSAAPHKMSASHQNILMHRENKTKQSLKRQNDHKNETQI